MWDQFRKPTTAPYAFSRSGPIVGYPEVIHLAVLSPYTANLCPLSIWFEFAGFRDDFGQSVRELVEAMLRSAVRQRTPEHLDGMLSEQQRIDDTACSCGALKRFETF